MEKSLVETTGDGQILFDIVQFLKVRLDLDLETAKKRYEDAKPKKQAKWHNFHQDEVINELMEKKEEFAGEEIAELFGEYTCFYFTKFQDKTSMDQVEEGKEKAKERFIKKLKLPEQYLIHRALTVLPGLENDREQMKGWLDDWKKKYEKQKEENKNMKEENKKLSKEVKKLEKEKKFRKEIESQKSAVAATEEESPTKSPTKRKIASTETPLKERKRRRVELFKTAPAKPPLTALALYTRNNKENGKSVEELKNEFNRFTDDQKRSLRTQVKEQQIAYFESMKEWLNSLPDEDRREYESSKMKNKPLKMPTKMKVEDYFPDLPKKPSNNLFMYVRNECKDKLEAVLEEEGKPNTMTNQASAAKTYISGLTPKRKQKLEKKMTKQIESRKAEIEEYLNNLNEENRCKYDELIMDNTTPQWLKDEPKAPQSLYAYYCSKMRTERGQEFATKSLAETSKMLSQLWKNIEGEQKQIVTESYEKAKSKHKSEHDEWYNGLNEYQQALLEKIQRQKKAFGPSPMIESSNIAFDLLAKMNEVPDNQQFDIFINSEHIERIGNMYKESVGLKVKKASTRKQKWKRIIENQKHTEIKAYLQTLAKRKKVSFVKSGSEEDDRVPEDEYETIENNASPTEDGDAGEKTTPKKTKSWKKRMAEYGPNHPKKPDTVFLRFKKMMTSNGLKDSKEISRLYKINKEDVEQCKKEYETDLQEYKELVSAWLETLDEDKRELYEKNEMRTAKKSDRNNKSIVMEVTGTQDLDYLDLQPKTPAPIQYESSDEESSA